MQLNKLPIRTLLTVIAILVYALFTRPLNFAFYIPIAVRVFVEVIPLALLTFSVRSYFSPRIIGGAILFYYLSINYLVNEASFQTSFLTFIKLLFLLVLLEILNTERAVFDLLKSLFIKFWVLVSASVIASAVLFWVAREVFTYSPLIVSEAGDAYAYYNNPFLGNIRISYFFGVAVAKVSWYFIEAGPLSFFFAFNFLSAKYLIDNQKKQIRFQWLSLIAGMSTLSISFYIFLVFVLGYMLLSKWKLYFGIAIIILLTAIALGSTGDMFESAQSNLTEFFNKHTSQNDRARRFDIFEQLLNKSATKTLLIGNGAGLEGLDVESGISSGWLSHFAERGGLFALMLMGYSLYLLRYQLPLFFVILYYNFSFEFFLFPIFSVMLGLAVSGYYRQRNAAVADENLSCLTN
jgi:hypothetical protein